MQAQELLLRALTPENLGSNMFRFPSMDLGFGHVFGGQFLAQAVAASYETAPDSAKIYHLSGTFLERVAPNTPLVYQVTTVRDGRSNCVRQIGASRDGEADLVFHATVALNLSTRRGSSGTAISHQAPMPTVKGPEGSESEWAQLNSMQDIIPQEYFRKRELSRVFDLRLATPIDFRNPQKIAPLRHTWIKSLAALKLTLSQRDAIVAYISDCSFLGVALQPHGLSGYGNKVRLASMNHTIYWHAPADLDAWLLYETTSPTTGNQRGYVEGRLFGQNGTLIASTSQQGLIKVS